MGSTLNGRSRKNKLSVENFFDIRFLIHSDCLQSRDACLTIAGFFDALYLLLTPLRRRQFTYTLKA
jgi:hypothetical protein